MAEYDSESKMVNAVIASGLLNVIASKFSADENLFDDPVLLESRDGTVDVKIDVSISLTVRPN